MLQGCLVSTIMIGRSVLSANDPYPYFTLPQLVKSQILQVERSTRVAMGPNRVAAARSPCSEGFGS